MAKPAVWMIGWEYPPHNSGGLGVACEGLTKALADETNNIYFTLPYTLTGGVDHMQCVSCVDPGWDAQASDRPPFLAYRPLVRTPADVPLSTDGLIGLPQSEIEHKVTQYKDIVLEKALAVSQNFQLIHAHDWMSFAAGIDVKRRTKKPLITHIHSTEFDRIPHGYGSSYIHRAEREGLRASDTIIAVSHYTKYVLVEKYGIEPRKIQVVHNGVDPISWPSGLNTQFAQKRPVVVFLGRLTMQKGPEYFVQLARRVTEELPDALFVMAGHGDMYHRLLLSTAEEGLSAQVLFTGFLRSPERERLLDRADVFVMPSLSEPFGIVALEAAQRHTPVIVSKQTGVVETLPSAIAIDFWDVEKMAKTVIELTQDKRRHQQVTRQQVSEVKKLSWERAAEKVSGIYRRFLTGRN